MDLFEVTPLIPDNLLRRWYPLSGSFPKIQGEIGNKIIFFADVKSMNRVKLNVVVLDELDTFCFRIFFFLNRFGKKKKKKRREKNFLKVLKFYKNLFSWKEEWRIFSVQMKCFYYVIRIPLVPSIGANLWKIKLSTLLKLHRSHYEQTIRLWSLIEQMQIRFHNVIPHFISTESAFSWK